MDAQSSDSTTMYLSTSEYQLKKNLSFLGAMTRGGADITKSSRIAMDRFRYFEISNI